MCLDCYRDQIRAMTPTPLVRNEERIVYGLFKYFLGCGLSHKDALRRLEFDVAMSADMYTRMLPLLDKLGKQNNGR